MNYLMVLWTLLLFIWTAFLFNTHNLWKIIDNRERWVEIHNINMLSRLKRNNLDTTNLINKNIIDNIKIWNTVLQSNIKDIVYGWKIVPEVWYKYKKALYLSKAIWYDMNKISNSNNTRILTLTNVKDNLVCKNGYSVNISSISKIIKKLKIAKININTFKDVNWNVKTINQIKTLLWLTNKETNVLSVIANKKCNLANWSIGKSYMFIPKRRIKSVLYNHNFINSYSSYFVDVVDKNTLQTLGEMVPLLSLSAPIKITKWNGWTYLKDITKKTQLDQVCDAGFYFDQSKWICKPNIEKHLELDSFFSVVKWNKLTTITNKIWDWLMLDPTKEYYVSTPNKKDWIENWIYSYNWNITTTDNITYNTWYSVSLWFTPKTENSTILTTSNNKLKLYNVNWKLKVDIQWKTIDIWQLMKGKLYNVFISYDKITNRLWIYFNDSPVIKAIKNNATSNKGYIFNIDLWNKFILWKWNEYYMFKVWSEWFGDYLINLIYNLENNLGINYSWIPNPWFKNTYNWAIICNNTKWLTTIQWTQGIGIVNCKLPSRIPWKISMYNTFNKGIKAWKLQTDIWTNLLNIKDSNNILNINALNHIFTEYKNNNIWMNTNDSSDLDVNLWFKLNANDLSDSNWYTLSFILRNANDGIISKWPFEIKKDNSTLTIDNKDFTYSTNSDNTIVITTNSLTNETNICVNNNNWTDCKTISWKLNNWKIRFINWIIDNLGYKPYAIQKETAAVISENLSSDNPSLSYITSCNKANNNGVYTIKRGHKLFNAVCYGGNWNKNILVYTSIYSKFNKNSKKLDNKWKSLRWNWNIQYYSDIVDVCRQYDLKPFIIKWNNTDWYDNLKNILHNYTNYYNWANTWGLAIWLWYDQSKEWWYNIDNMSSNWIWAGTFSYKLWINLPKNVNGNSMNGDYKFASFWAGKDNKNWPEDFKGWDTLWIICGGKENEWVEVPLQIVDFNIPNNNLNNRSEYIYNYNWTSWTKWDFYACPIGEVYDRDNDVCKKASNGSLFKVFDLSAAYKANYNIHPENNKEMNQLDHKYYTGDYIEGVYTWTDYNKIWNKDYTKLKNNNPYDVGNGDTLYWVKAEWQLCINKAGNYKFAVDGWWAIEFVLKVWNKFYWSKKYGDKKANKNKIDILSLNLKKWCYSIVLRYSSSNKSEDNYVVWFNGGLWWNILKWNYLKMYNSTNYLNQDTEPTITVTN